MHSRTESAFLERLRRFGHFHGGADPRTLGTAQVRRFQEHLAVEQNVAASTQNQAFSALLFACHSVFGNEWGNLSETARAA